MISPIKSQMREILLERYGVDINEAKAHFSTQNYAFIFPEKPYMIRVSITPKKSKAAIMSELMWVDDLKAYAQTICEPNTSLTGHILEEFEIDGTVYRACMFRTARGNVKATIDMNPMFFICVGELLGTIHTVSTDERALGMNYKRDTLKSIMLASRERCKDKLDKNVLDHIDKIMAQVDELPEDLGKFGICHGDFHANNFFVEGNNVWLFDFDGCCYANYLYDVASFVQSCFLMGYKPGEDRKKLLYEDILPYFRIGYDLEKKTDDHYWDDIEKFIAYRTALTVMALSEIDECGVTDDFDGIKSFFNYIITQDDIMDAMTEISKKQIGG